MSKNTHFRGFSDILRTTFLLCFALFSTNAIAVTLDCTDGVIVDNATAYTPTGSLDVCVAGTTGDDCITNSSDLQTNGTLVSTGSSYNLSDSSYLDTYIDGQNWSVSWGGATVTGYSGCFANSWKTKYDVKTSITGTYGGCGCSLDKQRWVVYGNVVNTGTWTDKNNYCRANCPSLCAQAIAEDSTFRAKLFNGVCPTPETPTTCDDGYYMEYNSCNACPGDYPNSDSTSATSIYDCYKTWECAEIPNCPEHSAECIYLDETSGIDYYGTSSEHCQIIFDCESGYNYTEGTTSISKGACFTNVDTDTDGTKTYAHAYKDGADYCYIDYSEKESNCSNYKFDSLSLYEWETDYDYGALIGDSACSTSGGTYATSGTPSSESGKYCWCKATALDSCTATDTKWVFLTDEYVSYDTCTNHCASRCSQFAQSQSAFRVALFASGAPETTLGSCEIKTYNITYDLDGGTNNSANPSTYTVVDNIVLANPTKDGYTFDGWTNDDADIITEIPTGSTGDITLYAFWTANTITINWSDVAQGYPNTSSISFNGTIRRLSKRSQSLERYLQVGHSANRPPNKTLFNIYFLA